MTCPLILCFIWSWLSVFLCGVVEELFCPFDIQIIDFSIHIVFCLIQFRVGKFLTLVVKTSGFWRLKPSCQKQVFDKNMSKTSKNPHEHKFKINMTIHLVKNKLFYIPIELPVIRSLIVISECWLEYTLFIQMMALIDSYFELSSKWAQLTHARVIVKNCCIQ